MTDEKLEKGLKALPMNIQVWVGALVGALNNVAQITSVARYHEEEGSPIPGLKREDFLKVLDLLSEAAPTRHRKAQVGLIKEALERFWTEKDAGLIPSPNETLQ